MKKICLLMGGLSWLLAGCGGTAVSEKAPQAPALVAAFEVHVSPSADEPLEIKPLALSQISTAKAGSGDEAVEIVWPAFRMYNSTTIPGAPSCTATSTCWISVNVCDSLNPANPSDPCTDQEKKNVNKCCKKVGCGGGCVLDNVRWTLSGLVAMKNQSSTNWLNPVMVLDDFTGGPGQKVSVYSPDNFNWATDNPQGALRTTNPHNNQPYLTFGDSIAPGQLINADQVLWIRDNNDHNDSAGFRFNAYVFADMVY